MNKIAPMLILRSPATKQNEKAALSMQSVCHKRSQIRTGRSVALLALALIAMLLCTSSCKSPDREDNGPVVAVSAENVEGLLDESAKLLEGLDPDDAAKLNKAVRLAEKAVKTSPGSAAPHVALGKALLVKVQASPDEAEKILARATHSFETALSLEPANRDELLGLSRGPTKKPATANSTGALLGLIEVKFASGQGADESVVELLDRITALEPDWPDPTLTLARYLRGSGGRSGPGIQWLENSAAKMPDNLHLLSEAGIALFLKDRFETAEKIFLRVLELVEATPPAPDSLEELRRRQAQEYLGRIYVEQGKTDEAEKLLQKAAENLEEFNKNHRGYWGCPYQALGVLYSKIGQPTRAAQYYMKTADTENRNAPSQIMAAIQCLNAGDHACASRYADRAMALSDSGWYAAVAGFVLLLKQDTEKAAKLFDQAAQSEETATAALVGQGHLCLVKQDYTCTADKLGKALSKGGGAIETEALYDPHLTEKNFINQMALLGMGWMAANQARHEEALGHYDQLLTHQDTNLLALLGKGNSLAGLKKLDQAEAVFNKVLELYPDNPYALAELAIVQYNRGQDKKAEQTFRKALAQADPGYTCPYEGLGLVYLRQGKLDKAKTNFEKAIEINPNIEYKKFNGLAKILIKEGKIDEAKKLLQKSIENYPYDEEAKELMAELKSR
jgi:tetratricopeptide (TPR) repeat protein